MQNNFNKFLKFQDSDISEKELIQKSKTNSNYRNILFARYYRFVIGIAMKYRHTSIPLDDLVQEGFLGVLHAVKKYNYIKSKFITYCHYWVRNYMGRLVSREMNLIRLPEHLIPAMNGLRNNNGSKYRKEDKEKAQQYLNDTAAIRNGDDGLQSSVVNKGMIYDRLDAEYLLKKVKHRDMIERRFGFTDGEVWTLERIAQKYNLSRERIRQIIDKELRILRGRNNSRFK